MPNLSSFRLFVRPFVAAALTCGIVATPALLSAQTPYKILDKWKIGGEGGWDDLRADSGPTHINGPCLLYA
jgi:hypothetical protein